MNTKCYTHKYYFNYSTFTFNYLVSPLQIVATRIATASVSYILDTAERKRGYTEGVEGEYFLNALYRIITSIFICYPLPRQMSPLHPAGFLKRKGTEREIPCGDQKRGGGVTNYVREKKTVLSDGTEEK